MQKKLILKETLMLSPEEREKLRQRIMREAEEGCAIIPGFIEVVCVDDDLEVKDESEAAEL